MAFVVCRLSIMDYSGKTILAPMVRIGTLPFRLLCLSYGADIVYCEEIIDFKILNSTRIQNDLLKTIDYVAPDGTIVFSTCIEEKDKVIFQMGTSDAKRALNVARVIEDDVAGIDVNMGCPKEFSIKGGMGAALLTQPEKVKEILTTLVQGTKKPITCKIRILSTIQDTVELARLIEKTGVKAIAVHGRERCQRSSEPCNYDYMRAISDAVSIPVIANGGSLDIKKYADIELFKNRSGCSSIMLARQAQWNPSIFRKEGFLSQYTEIRDYIRNAVDYDNNFPSTKYCVCQLMHKSMETNDGKLLSASKAMSELCEIFGLDSYYVDVLKRRKRKLEQLQTNNELHDNHNDKKMKLDDVVYKNLKFIKNEFPRTITPKMVLHEHVKQQKWSPVEYKTEVSSERLFKSVVTVHGRKYGATSWEKSKQAAEQAAAMVFLHLHAIHDGRKNACDSDFIVNFR